MKSKPRFRVIKCAGKVGVLDRKTQMVAGFMTESVAAECAADSNRDAGHFDDFYKMTKSAWQIRARNAAQSKGAL